MQRLNIVNSACVHRESFRTFRELSEIFSDDNNYSLSRELLVKVGHSYSQHTQKWPLPKQDAHTISL